jgi:MFS family permease
MTQNGDTSDPNAALATAPLEGPAALAPPAGNGPDAAAPGARYALIVLLTINLFNYIDRNVLSAVLGPVERETLPPPTLPSGEPNPEARHNDERKGDLGMAFILAFMVFAPVFGWLATFCPRWKLVGVAVLIWTFASGASGLAGGWGLWVGFWVLLATRCFVGVGEAAYGPIAPDMISDLYPVRQRAYVLSWFYVAIPVGGAVGFVLGGLAGYPLAFYLVVPPGILLGVWCFFMPEPPRGKTDRAQVRPLRLRDYLLLFRTPSYVLATLGMAALMYAIGAIALWMPYYVANYRHAASEETAGLINGGIIVVAGLGATVLGGMAGDALRGRFSGAYFLVSAAAMLIGFPFFLAALYTPFPLAWVFIFITCFCLFFNTGPTNAILANVIHPSLRPQAFGFNIFFIHLLGDAFSPKVVGIISDANGHDLNAGFLSISAAVLIAAVFWLVGMPFLARDTARAPKQLDAANA